MSYTEYQVNYRQLQILVSERDIQLRKYQLKLESTNFESTGQTTRLKSDDPMVRSQVIVGLARFYTVPFSMRCGQKKAVVSQRKSS